MLSVLVVLLLLSAETGLLVLLGSRWRGTVRAPRPDAASLQRSLSDAQLNVDLILAAAARRMHELSRRDDEPGWKEW